MSQTIRNQSVNASDNSARLGFSGFVSSDELHLRRMHKQMSARSVPRRFLWTNPLSGVAVVMDFRPEGSARQSVQERRFLPAG